METTDASHATASTSMSDTKLAGAEQMRLALDDHLRHCDMIEKHLADVIRETKGDDMWWARDDSRGTLALRALLDEIRAYGETKYRMGLSICGQ